jgi:hypothetical protein
VKSYVGEHAPSTGLSGHFRGPPESHKKVTHATKHRFAPISGCSLGRLACTVQSTHAKALRRKVRMDGKCMTGADIEAARMKCLSDREFRQGLTSPRRMIDCFSVVALRSPFRFCIQPLSLCVQFGTGRSAYLSENRLFPAPTVQGLRAQSKSLQYHFRSSLVLPLIRLTDEGPFDTIEFQVRSRRHFLESVFNSLRPGAFACAPGHRRCHPLAGVSRIPSCCDAFMTA